MFRAQLQSSGDGFRSGGEAPVEAKTTGVPALADERVDEEQVCLRRRDDPASVRGDIDADDGVSQRRQRRLRVLADRVEQTDVTFLRRDRELALRGRGDAGEFVLGHVLFVLAVDELAPRNTRVDAEERVPRCTDEGLLRGHLRELVFGRDVSHGNVLMNLPLFDDLSSFEVEMEQRVLIILVHNDHLGILIVQHDFSGIDLLSLGSLDLADGRVVFDLIPSMTEDTNVVAANNIRTISLVTNCELRVLLTLGQSWR